MRAGGRRWGLPLAAALLVVWGCEGRTGQEKTGAASVPDVQEPAPVPAPVAERGQAAKPAPDVLPEAAGQEASAASAAEQERKATERRRQEALLSPHAPKPSEDVLAWMGDDRITREEFERYLNRLPPFQRREYASLEKKVELLRHLIRFETLARKAAADGLDKDPDVMLALKTEMIKKYLEQRFGEGAAVEITDEEIARRYQDDITRYRRPERVRVNLLLTSEKAAADKALAEVRSGLARAGASPRQVFRDAVDKYSQDAASKQRGGDTLYFDHAGQAEDGRTIDPVVVEAAFALQNAEQVTTVLQGAGGYFVVQLVSRQKALDRPLSEVKEEIRATLRSEKLDRERREFMDTLVDFDAWHMEMGVLNRIPVEAEPPSGQMGARMESISPEEGQGEEEQR